MKIRTYAMHAERRKKLVKAISQQHAQDGVVVLFADFEQDRVTFRQESSFFYYTGVEEPGAVAVIDVRSGDTQLMVANCVEKRAQWVTSVIVPTAAQAKQLGVEKILTLGAPCAGYQLYPFSSLEEYSTLTELLAGQVKSGNAIYALAPQAADGYVTQRMMLQKISGAVRGMADKVIDIAPLVAAARRSKDKYELECMHKAIEVTGLAQEAAARSICEGATEAEVQGALEYIMVGSGLRSAFPSIVAAGSNGTILHHTPTRDVMQKGDLVIVDIGAEYNYYCADITRTFPVSGKFTKRQREIYELVLETQEYVASLAQPGYWLSNKEHPDKSLNHLARAYLKEKGYDQYFTHGIGHYLGMDVHDVGDYATPLAEGDVITIEPGIYIPEEGIGIRLEDNYWIVKDGAICLTEALPNSIKDIEAIARDSFE